MATPFSNEQTVLPLSVIRLDAPNQTSEIYLLLSESKPIVLGTGRFAEVWLASEGPDVPNSRLLALKFVRKDPESAVVTAVARWRFFEEMLKTSQKAPRAGIINYFAFGTIKDSYNWEVLDVSKDDINLQSEHQFFAKDEHRKLVNAIAASNSKRFAGDIAKEAEDLQGEFYAMTAAHGTLEDLLLLPHDWKSNYIYRRTDTQYSHSLSQFRSDKKEQLAGLVKACLPESSRSQDRSGLAILKDLRDPCFRNRTVLLIASRLAKALSALHSMQVAGQGYLAHRDLKLGNFLLVGGGQGEDLGNLTVTLSDLGFVGGNESVAASRMSGKLNAREASVLPPGTFPFRAPEQIQPVFEVTCTIMGSPVPSPNVRLRTFTDLELEVGDWIESPDLIFGDEQQREKRARIENVAWNGDGLLAGRVAECTLTCGVRYKKDVSEAKGSVIKAAGQHSDYFSLGSIVYFIATGGRNPEAFWARCVSLAQQTSDANGLSAEKTAGGSINESSVFGTCEAFAIALSDDGSDVFKKDVAHLQQLTTVPSNTSPSKKKGIFSPDKNADFVRMLTNSPSIRPLLLDSNGARLTLPVLLGVLRCMLRGKPDSFVTPTHEERLKPMSVWQLQSKAVECATMFANLTQYPSASLNRDAWIALGKDVDDLFFALRIGGTVETELHPVLAIEASS